MTLEGDRKRLSGKRVLLTGGSGFLGMAVLSALLRHANGFERLTLLLRAGDDAAAKRRLSEEVLANDAFDRVPRDRVGEMLASERLRAVAGDLASARIDGQGWGEVDILINCAASVSFEEPLDDALELNAFGPGRLLRALREAGSDPCVVHVSTAYVADCHVDVVHEDGLPHPALATLDPEAMLAEARSWRQLAEAKSLRPAERRRFARQARRDIARKPGLDPQARTEELRRRWVRQALSELGRRRAAAVGWPDTYTLSKALGEQELIGSTERLTIVRPSIIESALSEPYPGWLEGLKVADPLILAYAAGGLTHIAGRSTNLIDIVPVDCVANACVAAALHPPAAGPRALAISSTARNPLRIGELAACIKAHFRREPLRLGGRPGVRIGDLEFVPRRAAVGAAARRERLARTASAAAAAPISARAKRKLRATAFQASQITRMARIYAPYTELDCVFDDANTRAFAAGLPVADRLDLPFDPGIIEWSEYLEFSHLPAVQQLATRPS